MLHVGLHHFIRRELIGTMLKLWRMADVSCRRTGCDSGLWKFVMSADLQAVTRQKRLRSATCGRAIGNRGKSPPSSRNAYAASAPKAWAFSKSVEPGYWHKRCAARGLGDVAPTQRNGSRMRKRGSLVVHGRSDALSDCKDIPHDQHPDHQFRINRWATRRRIMRGSSSRSQDRSGAASIRRTR